MGMKKAAVLILSVLVAVFLSSCFKSGPRTEREEYFLTVGYEDGYEDGYNNGFEDGFEAGMKAAG